MITLQYLEDAPDLPGRDTAAVVDRLRLAADLLPFTHLLIGWNLPIRLMEACRREAERLGIRFLRWHSLLAGDAAFQSRPEWQVIGAAGHKVQGYRNMPELSFPIQPSSRRSGVFLQALPGPGCRIRIGSRTGSKDDPGPGTDYRGTAIPYADLACWEAQRRTCQEEQVCSID